jgi:hypothetical protein
MNVLSIITRMNNVPAFDKCKCPICQIIRSKTKHKIPITSIASPLFDYRCLSIQLPSYIVLTWYSKNSAIKYIIFFWGFVFHEFHTSCWKMIYKVDHHFINSILCCNDAFSLWIQNNFQSQSLCCIEYFGIE